MSLEHAMSPFKLASNLLIDEPAPTLNRVWAQLCMMSAPAPPLFPANCPSSVRPTDEARTSDFFVRPLSALCPTGGI
eukprot:7377320-Prymnesium_polylepis.2